MALCWLTGLLLGFCAAKYGHDSAVIAATECTLIPVEFCNLLAVCILPFVICTFAYFSNAFWLAAFVFFSKGFGFGFCATAVGLAFGAAGWLVRFLFLFSDCLIAPALIAFWFAICGKVRHKICVGLALLYAITVALVDYSYIAPLLSAVLS